MKSELRYTYTTPTIHHYLNVFYMAVVPRIGLPGAQEQKLLPWLDLPRPSGESGPAAGKVQCGSCSPDSRWRGSSGYEKKVSYTQPSLNVSMCVFLTYATHWTQRSLWRVGGAGPCRGHFWTQAGPLLECTCRFYLLTEIVQLPGLKYKENLCMVPLETQVHLVLLQQRKCYRMWPWFRGQVNWK